MFGNFLIFDVVFGFVVFEVIVHLGFEIVFDFVNKYFDFAFAG